jgi:histidinol-phosphatase
MLDPQLTAEIAPRLALARTAGVEAGDLTLEYFQREGLGVERKGDQSPVTVADRGAEERLRERIAAAFPQDAILGEEFGEVAGTSGFRWILDPIDGTKSFISGVPLYGTMVGVEHEGRALVGFVYIPGLREGVFAAADQGTWHFLTVAQSASREPRRVQVSKREKLAEGLFVTSQVDTFAKRGAMAAFEALQHAAYITRTWGDCYGYLLVATGRAEVMVDPMLNIWDAAAIQPIIEEAGGTFTDWQGNPTIHAGEAIATNGLVLEEVLRATAAAPRLSA